MPRVYGSGAQEPPMQVVNRAGPAPVALETTLLAHGVPPGEGPALAAELADIILRRGASPAIVGVLDGFPIVGMNERELGALLSAPHIPKLNTANLGAAL